MSEMIKVTLSLVVIFIAAGLIMGGTYMTTSPIRYIAEQREHEEALKLMAPDATDPIHAAGKWTINRKEREYYVATSSGRTVAYIADTSGKGYSSFIQMLVSLDPGLKVRDVSILHHGETPGLGDQIENRELFLDQFKGKGLSQLVLIKGETKENIQAITGATISSRAVTNGVRDAVQMLVDKYGAGVGTAAQGTVKHEHR